MLKRKVTRKAKNRFMKIIPSILLFVTVNCSILAQPPSKKQITHKVYGSAIEETHVRDGIERIKVIYTTDTTFIPGYLEVGEMTLYSDTKKVEAHGGFRTVTNKKIFGPRTSRYRYGKWHFYDKNGKIAAIVNYENNKKHGLYTSYHKNGKISSTGTYENGLPTDIEKVFFENGQLHKITAYKESKIQNILDFKNKRGKKISHGTLKEGNGTLKTYDLITGQFIKTYTAENGILKDIEIDTIATSEGNRIEKKYKNDDGEIEKIIKKLDNSAESLHEYYVDGNLKESIYYVNDEKHGLHTQYNLDGTIFQQYHYVNGEKHGKYTAQCEGYKAQYYAYEEGFYKKDTLDGIYRRYLQEKNKTDTSFVINEKRHLIQSGTYEMGVKTGTWKVFDLEGLVIDETFFGDSLQNTRIEKEFYEGSKQLKSIKTYDLNDETIRVKTFYDNGQLSTSTNYIKQKGFSKKHGNYKSYYEDGQLHIEGDYKKDKKNGVWKKYNEGGHVVEEYTYDGNYITVREIDYYYQTKDSPKLSKIIFKDVRKRSPEDKRKVYFEIKIIKRYDANGILKELESRKKYKFGFLDHQDGIYKLYYNGDPILEGLYHKDKKEGTWKTYHENGELKEIGSYTEDKKTGTWTTFDPKGFVVDETQYSAN